MDDNNAYHATITRAYRRAISTQHWRSDFSAAVAGQFIGTNSSIVRLYHCVRLSSIGGSDRHGAIPSNLRPSAHNGIISDSWFREVRKLGITTGEPSLSVGSGWCGDQWLRPGGVRTDGGSRYVQGWRVKAEDSSANGSGSGNNKSSLLVACALAARGET